MDIGKNEHPLEPGLEIGLHDASSLAHSMVIMTLVLHCAKNAITQEPSHILPFLNVYILINKLIYSLHRIRNQI